MAKLYPKKYRKRSYRLRSWNYGWSAGYFVSINTQNRTHFFGEISNGQMFLSEIGQIVLEEWHRTFEIRADMHLSPDAFVIMPNHIHFIIFIGSNRFNSVQFDATHCRSFPYGGNQFGPQSKNLASIIRGFKSAVTIRAREVDPDFKWQKRYHEKVIRNERSLELIRYYIDSNVFKWAA